ncbi:hypothetical protein T02_3470 [Trichinella nativa]|uniref:Uncharacterized protein n=1 Tax=Trichinella nativa TaxID=6335 RepID=A0A0V1L3A5_9BILA|nr:hypothetical protein T02_3470 [Trichinella nativa]
MKLKKKPQHRIHRFNCQLEMWKTEHDVVDDFLFFEKFPYSMHKFTTSYSMPTFPKKDSERLDA